jgi:DNA invertase Pin-like site-specific DNA recombinase
MKKEIIELRKQGLTINEIVKKIGCAKSTVSYHINNVGMGAKKESVDNDLTELIKTYRLELKTYDEIHKLLGISRDKIIKICREFGLNKPVNHYGVRLKLDADEVIKYYQSVKSLRATAKHFKIDKHTLRINYITDDKLIKQSKKTFNEVKNSKVKAVISWRKRKKKELVEYKGGCCEKCGYNKSIEVLQFHHLDPNEKDFTISGKSYSIERLKKEVDKCILVCANCHIEIHEELRNK